MTKPRQKPIRDLEAQATQWKEKKEVVSVYPPHGPTLPPAHPYRGAAGAYGIATLTFGLGLLGLLLAVLVVVKESNLVYLIPSGFLTLGAFVICLAALDAAPGKEEA